MLFAAGTGNPYFTTDTAAALRSLEIGAEAILMAKNGVAGVYDGDPSTDPDAAFLPALTYREAIERGLKVMDTTALSLCMDNGIPIHVFEQAPGNIRRVVAGERVGTIISKRRRQLNGNGGRVHRGRGRPHGQVGRACAQRVQHRAHRPRVERRCSTGSPSTTTARRRRSSSSRRSTSPSRGMLTIQPFDPSSIKAIEKAIQESDLGLQAVERRQARSGCRCRS